MKQITPCLWFDTQAEAAAQFYTSLFPNSRILEIARYGDAGPGPSGSVMTVRFAINGQEYIGLNGGPHFQFNEAVSFSIDCENQEEVDFYWSKLTDGGEEGPCGWVKDRFGLSWQVNPTALERMLTDSNREKADRAMRAMLTMKKFDIAALERAFNGA